MVAEIQIILKEDKVTSRHPYLIYKDTDGSITLDRGCQKLASLVEEAKAKFVGTPDRIIVKATYVWE